jgi:hypothetical protein
MNSDPLEHLTPEQLEATLAWSKLRRVRRQRTIFQSVQRGAPRIQSPIMRAKLATQARRTGVVA